MKSITGLFDSRRAAEVAMDRLRAAGFFDDRVSLLTPDASEAEIEDVPTSETEQPGTGAAIGGVVGGAVGASSGAVLGPAIAALVLPGIGPVVAVGTAAMALLGALGVLSGAAVGKALEDSFAAGVPKDEIAFYERALANGRSVLIALVEDDEERESVRQTLIASGATEVDSAQRDWRVGLPGAFDGD